MRSRRYTLKEALVENSEYKNQSSLIKRIRKAGLLAECCPCGQGPEWKGKPLTLQLDHKNGIANDHRIENLQFICPNCHTQTETYGSKNRGSGRKYKREYYQGVRLASYNR